jgi:hypothetical protein
LNKKYDIDENFPRSNEAPNAAIVGGDDGFWPHPSPPSLTQKNEPSPSYDIDEKFNRPAKPPTEAEVGGNQGFWPFKLAQKRDGDSPPNPFGLNDSFPRS